MLFITWFSERVNQRSLVGFIAQLWILPCLIAMYLLPAAASKWASFAVVTTLLSYPYRKFPMKLRILDWLLLSTRDAGCLEQSQLEYRSHENCFCCCVQVSLTVQMCWILLTLDDSMTAQLASIIFSNIYRSDDAPLCTYFTTFKFLGHPSKWFFSNNFQTAEVTECWSGYAVGIWLHILWSRSTTCLWTTSDPRFGIPWVSMSRSSTAIVPKMREAWDWILDSRARQEKGVCSMLGGKQTWSSQPGWSAMGKK